MESAAQKYFSKYEDYYRDQAVIQAKIKQLTEEKEQIAAEKVQIEAEKEQADARAEQESIRAEQATARAEQISSEAEFLRKLLSENGISIPENMKKL